jgi:hypothetical protein
MPASRHAVDEVSLPPARFAFELQRLLVINADAIAAALSEGAAPRIPSIHVSRCDGCDHHVIGAVLTQPGRDLVVSWAGGGRGLSILEPPPIWRSERPRTGALPDPRSAARDSERAILYGPRDGPSRPTGRRQCWPDEPGAVCIEASG